eukprot:9412504-Alexandrium_andersonii.AAC.1
MSADKAPEMFSLYIDRADSGIGLDINNSNGPIAMNYHGGGPLASIGNDVCYVTSGKTPAGQLFFLVGFLEANDIPINRS